MSESAPKSSSAMPVIRLKTEPRGGHPWIFRKMLERPEPGGARDGDAVRVYSREGRFLGRGFYNGNSQIGLRILDRGGENEPIGTAFWKDRIGAAARLRREVLGLPRTTDAYRVVNSEGDGLSGLVVDLYKDHAVVEVHSLGIWRQMGQIEQALRSVLELSGVHFRADERIQRLESFTMKSAAGSLETTVTENGVKFVVDVKGGHKTGFFCDQRDSRQLVASLSGGKRVLDLCCYTGGFGLAAKVAGKAAEVTGVDLDEWAVAAAQKNAKANGLEGPKAGIRYVHANAFAFLKEPRDAKDHWDVVVLDPPKLAPSKEDLDNAMRAYYDLNRFALRNVKAGGLFTTCSCSGLVTLDAFMHMLVGAAADAGRELRILKVNGHGVDHPVHADCPEGVYLKVVLAQVLPRR